MTRSVLAAALAAVLLLPAFGTQSTNAATSLSIVLRCYSNPEKTTIKNTGTTTFTIRTVGSTYQPYSYEPFSVGKKLLPGQSVTYQTGRAAVSNVLTRNYIYNNNGLDGVRVVTSVSKYTKRC